MTKIWVGKRESDIITYPYFDFSITFWGSNSHNNYSFCTSNRIKSDYGNAFSDYVLHLLKEYICKNDDVEIHFYNNMFAYKMMDLDPSLRKYIVNVPPKRVLDITRHKTLSRVWLQNTVGVPDFACLSKCECCYEQLIQKFPSYGSFIVQKNISSGGDGTYLINKQNAESVVSKLTPSDVYLVSPYYKDNISLSCHILIDDKNVIVFPVSKQLLDYDNNRISYCGNEYIKNTINLALLVKKAALTVGCKLREIDYRGICGLDFIFVNNEILLVEINPRYQGSSYVLNAALKANNLPSLFELNSVCFGREIINKNVIEQINEMNISTKSFTSFYKYGSSINTENCPQNSSLFLDGLNNAITYEDGVYLYRYTQS